MSEQISEDKKHSYKHEIHREPFAQPPSSSHTRTHTHTFQYTEGTFQAQLCLLSCSKQLCHTPHCVISQYLDHSLLLINQLDMSVGITSTIKSLDSFLSINKVHKSQTENSSTLQACYMYVSVYY